MTTDTTTPANWIPAALAGFAASLVGIGLARFAYTPLLPALIEAEWFSESDAVYLGAANLAGYLAGALIGRHLSVWTGPVGALRAMMLLASVSFIACAYPISFSWYFVWRFVAGLSGGALMVLAASTALPHVPPEKRGIAGGIIFTGVGLGIGLSGTLVPYLIDVGLFETWMWLGAICFVLSVAVWKAWPTEASARPTGGAQIDHASGAFGLPFTSLYVVYTLVAVGLVAHMVFLVDYVARGLGQGIHAGASYWVVFGAGAVIGPICAGRLADRITFKTTLRLFVLAEALAVALAYITAAPLALYVSSFMVGAIVPGIVPLIVGRAHQLSGTNAALQKKSWSYATVGFSVGQAGAGYVFSYLFDITGRYDLLFLIGSLAVATGFVIELLTPDKKE